MKALEKTSQILIYLLILAITNVFAVVEILEEYRIPGVGKPSDFVLIALILVLFFGILTRKNKNSPSEIRTLVKYNLVVIGYVCFLIFYTVSILEIESLNYALRTASHYLYYTSFLFPLFLIDNEKLFYKYINFLRLGALTTGVIAIVSNILGYSIVTGVISGEEGGFIRVYTPAFFNFFVILFWFVQSILKYKSKIKINYLEMVISALGILLFLGRTRIIVLLLMLIFIFLFVTRASKKKAKVVFAFSFLLLSVHIFLEYFNFPFEEIIDRFYTGFEKLNDPKDALTGRWVSIKLGYNVFIQYPIFGTGFVHHSTDFYINHLISSKGQALTSSADFGLVSILYTTGLFGFIIITLFIIRLLKYIYKILNNMRSRKYYTDKYTFGLVVFIIILMVFFIEQISSNEFGSRSVAIYLLSAGYAVKFLRIKEK